jgi:non-specific serine/threonine protein kinase
MHPGRPPLALTSLVGRERELDELTALVPAHRLVTLTGVGGTGKTRLAAELALRLDWQRADSVAWVELGPCTDAQIVAQQIASALSLRGASSCAALDVVAEALAERDFLLVLDNCEHLVQAVAGVARTLLLRCPRLRILATSREPLGVAGERIWPVPPIAPDDAVRLFAERAAAADPAFTLTDDNAPAVAEICRRLDRIPLAIELAAARVRVLTPEQIAARLEDRFALLTGGARTADPRHRTLRAAIDWSFALLSAEEQTLLARLSVFAGSFDLDAAASVCDAGLDLLGGLVDKSLLTAKNSRGAVRYRLLDTLRQYAAERLDERGEGDAVRRRHALAYLALVREMVVDPMGAVMARLERLDDEHDNVRAALAWSLEHEPDAIALPLAGEFRWYWYYRILWREGLRWLTRALERSADRVSRERASALAGAGAMAGYTGDLAAGRALLDQAVAMWRTLGDEHQLAVTLSALGQLQANAGDLDGAAESAEESVTLARRAGTSYEVAYCLANAAASLAERKGDLAGADAALAEAEEIWTSCRHPLGLPFALSTRARLAVARGDLAAASRFARATLVESRLTRDLWFAARALRVLAATKVDDLPRAARLLGASAAMLRTIGARMLLHETRDYDALMARLQGAELEAALAEGNRLGFEEAFELALAGDAEEASTLHVRDLGALQITLNGRPVAYEGRASSRVRELLVFLIKHPPGPTKEEVGVAFWPDATGEQVKNAFHVTLHRLRKVLGDSDAVAADGARYRVTVPHIVDSARFEAGAAEALRGNDIRALERAVALYRGDFLQGEEAGDWCFPIRAQLRQLYVRCLFALGQAQESRGRYADAAEAYERVLGRDPFHEGAARQLMICHSRLGARSESLQVYRKLEQRLREELQAAPEAATSDLYARLRHQSMLPSP